MDHLERVKLPGQAWNTMEESSSGGGSTAIDLSDTAATLSQSLVFDSRGVGSIGLYTDVDAVGPDSVNTLVFTRKTGKPWMYVPTLEISLGIVTLSSSTIWPLTGFSNSEWMDAYVGLLDESVVVVQPLAGSGTANASGDTSDASVTFSVGLQAPGGDYGNAFTVVLVDPGVPDSPISISSTMGYDFVISLATDGGGAITTTSVEMEGIVNGGGLGAGNVPQNWIIDCVNNGSAGPLVAEVIPMTGGDSNATAATYTVSGTY